MENDIAGLPPKARFYVLTTLAILGFLATSVLAFLTSILTQENEELRQSLAAHQQTLSKTEEAQVTKEPELHEVVDKITESLDTARTRTQGSGFAKSRQN